MRVPLASRQFLELENRSRSPETEPGGLEIKLEKRREEKGREGTGIESGGEERGGEKGREEKGRTEKQREG